MTVHDLHSDLTESVRIERDREKMSTLYASLSCGAQRIMLIAGELSQRMDDERPASKHQLDTVKRWIKSMTDDLNTYGPGERT